jgi:hypothetical protein
MNRKPGFFERGAHFFKSKAPAEFTTCLLVQENSILDSAADNPGHGFNPILHTPKDCGKLKQGHFDLPLDLPLKFCHPDRHIMDGFDPIFDSIDLPVNGLHNAFGVPGYQADVPTDWSHMGADRIDQFLCFPGSPADLEKNRDEENENQYHDRRNHDNTNLLEYNECVHDPLLFT